MLESVSLTPPIDLIRNPAFFYPANPVELSDFAHGQSLDRNGLEHLLQGPQAERLLEEQLTAGKRNRYMIGLLLGSMPSHRISTHVMAEFDIHVADTDDSVHPFNDGEFISLCQDAEGNMLRALENGSAFKINPWLVMKKFEKGVGLCIESTATNRGTFIKGGWYAPIGHEGREIVFGGQDFTDGSGYEGRWAYLRNVSFHLDSQASERFIDRVAAYAATR